VKSTVFAHFIAHRSQFHRPAEGHRQWHAP
jgi:hypothetical protein